MGWSTERRKQTRFYADFNVSEREQAAAPSSIHPLIIGRVAEEMPCSHNQTCFHYKAPV